jgi:cyclic lactone autoinducer peptide
MESFMKKETIEKAGLKIIGMMAKKLCVVNANSTCWYLAGQEVPPQELRKLRKK